MISKYPLGSSWLKSCTGYWQLGVPPHGTPPSAHYLWADSLRQSCSSVASLLFSGRGNSSPQDLLGSSLDATGWGPNFPTTRSAISLQCLQLLLLCFAQAVPGHCSMIGGPQPLVADKGLRSQLRPSLNLRGLEPYELRVCFALGVLIWGSLYVTLHATYPDILGLLTSWLLLSVSVSVISPHSAIQEWVQWTVFKPNLCFLLSCTSH